MAGRSGAVDIRATIALTSSTNRDELLGRASIRRTRLGTLSAARLAQADRQFAQGRFGPGWLGQSEVMPRKPQTAASSDTGPQRSLATLHREFTLPSTSCGSGDCIRLQNLCRFTCLPGPRVLHWKVSGPIGRDLGCGGCRPVAPLSVDPWSVLLCAREKATLSRGGRGSDRAPREHGMRLGRSLALPIGITSARVS